MLCCSACGTHIPPEFSLALKRNECPACGEPIMDEESLALMEDLQASIRETAAVRDSTAEQLALMLVTRYAVASRDGTPSPPPRPAGRRRAAPPRASSAPEGDEGIVRTSDLAESPISEEERQAILEERVRERYGMALSGESVVGGKKQELSPEMKQLARAGEAALSDNELMRSPLVEQERLKRLAKQQQNLTHGPPSAKSGAMVNRTV